MFAWQENYKFKDNASISIKFFVLFFVFVFVFFFMQMAGAYFFTCLLPEADP